MVDHGGINGLNMFEPFPLQPCFRCSGISIIDGHGFMVVSSVSEGGWNWLGGKDAWTVAFSEPFTTKFWKPSFDRVPFLSFSFASSPLGCAKDISLTSWRAARRAAEFVMRVEADRLVVSISVSPQVIDLFCTRLKHVEITSPWACVRWPRVVCAGSIISQHNALASYEDVIGVPTRIISILDE